jgi:hypothetical protein
LLVLLKYGLQQMRDFPWLTKTIKHVSGGCLLLIWSASHCFYVEYILSGRGLAFYVALLLLNGAVNSCLLLETSLQGSSLMIVIAFKKTFSDPSLLYHYYSYQLVVPEFR